MANFNRRSNDILAEMPPPLRSVENEWNGSCVLLRLFVVYQIKSAVLRYPNVIDVFSQCDICCRGINQRRKNNQLRLFQDASHI